MTTHTILDRPPADDHAPVPGPCPAPPSRPRRPGRAAAIGAAVLGVLGLGAVAVGGGLAWAGAAHGEWFDSGTGRVTAAGAAITSDEIDVDTAGVELGDLIRVRVEAHGVDAGRPLFVGIARHDDVDRYLRGVGRTVVDDFDTDPFTVDSHVVPGRSTVAPPATRDIWVASSEGPSGEVVWAPRDGEWTVVVMGADGRAGVVADVELGVAVAHLGAIAGGFVVAGLALLGSSVALVLRREP